MNNGRFVIAVLLTGAILWGWQSYLKTKYGLTQAVTADSTTASPSTAGSPSAPIAAPQGPLDLTASLLPSQSKQLDYVSPQVKLEVSESGMGIREIEVIGFRDRNQNPVHLGSDILFSIGDGVRPLNFQIEKKSDDVFVGTASTKDLDIHQTLTFHSDTYSVDGIVEIEKKTSDAKGLSFLFQEPFYTPPEKMPFASFEHQEITYRKEGKILREKIDSQKKANDVQSPASNLLSLSSQYFATAFLDQSGQLPEVSAYHGADKKDLYAQVFYSFSNRSTPIQIHWKGYYGPKSVALLEKADPELGDLVNYGFFSPIAKILLVILKWFHSFVSNWGLAIIFVTVLVRALVLPFNIMAYRSMKNMQIIQPKLQSLRERYKEDPMTLNRETMAMMKEHKVNPLGGCLPTLLQMPVFFALYQVLGQSIELYQAPFFGWIHDLSLRDPFFVLPVLMGATMFFQQKSSPTTMDPQQAKILKWMPVLFTFFTFSLPSGLTLYIFISTLFSLGQQKLFLRGGRT